jgi:2-dehydropantoate 2-reductase
MRILVVGAGAIGGYYGGRLLEAGQDVTFMVRPRRAADLAASGLRITSLRGDVTLPNPPTVLADNLREPYDLVLLSCKAYDLDGAIAAFAPAVGAQTAIMPLLNGMRHLDVLDQRFGADRVLGGQCLVAVTLDAHGTVVHLNDSDHLTFGERDRSGSERVRAISAAMAAAKFDARASDDILQSMWEKWVFLATLAGSTCLMRAAVGDIAEAPDGTRIVLTLFDECAAVAQASGHAPRSAFVQRSQATLSAAGSPLTASMLRDIERNAPIEADHIVGDLIRRGLQAGASPRDFSVLGVAHAHLKAYEARRRRMQEAAAGP